MPTPVIVVTDLYQPPEDPGDNFDLVLPFGLDRIDLRAIVLDVSIEKRESVSEGVPGYPGPREPGIIPVAQLNALFGRQVPYGISPFARMRTVDDQLRDVPPFQQTGPELLLDTLRASDTPVHLMSFGSARPIAVAYNRDPALFRDKVARIHLSAGSTSLDYLEWNVYLDPLAVIRLVDAGLPLALYPCATEVDCFSYGVHNTLWWFDDLRWIDGLHPALRRYLLYGLGVSTRIDFLRALDDDPPAEVAERVYGRRHAVWETAAWIEVSGSALVRHQDGTHEIVAAADVAPADVVVRNELVPCRAASHPTGLYTFEPADPDPNALVFVRDDPREYERALREALPRLYASFTPAGWLGSTLGPLRDAELRQYAGPLP
jgi:pyrimidine-specific ribonucleoside hydrolase